jgi:signal transduction histidine kinase
MQNPEYELNTEPLNIIAVAQDAMRSMRILLKERNMTGSVEYADACSFIEGDYDRIRQLFVILLQNAVKYGIEGSTIDVRIEKKDGWVCVLVRDFGSVIPQEEWEQIFEKFYRASNHGEKDGSGLGLVVAKHIVERHAGEISVTSSETDGTCFRMKFPETSENIT